MSTAAEGLYKVHSDNGLGGLVLGRNAAEELAEDLIWRTDVLWVSVEPVSEEGE